MCGMNDAQRDRVLPLLLMAFVVAASSAFLVPEAGRRWLSAGANLGIFASYLFVAAFIMPHVTVRYLSTRIAGAMFFLTCGLSHIEHFLHAAGGGSVSYIEPLHVVNHTVQLVAVIGFLAQLWREFLSGQSSWPPRLDFAIMFRRRRG